MKFGWESSNLKAMLINFKSENQFRAEPAAYIMYVQKLSSYKESGR